MGWHRVIVFLIVAFWLGTVGWLCAVVWAPPESRMTQIDPRSVYETFFQWNESTRMTILENGSRRGELVLAGGSGEDPGSGRYTNNLSFACQWDQLPSMRETAKPPGEGADLFFRGNLEFDELLSFEEAEISGRIPQWQISARLAIGGEPPAYQVLVTSHRNPVFEQEGAWDRAALLPLLMASLGGQAEWLAGQYLTADSSADTWQAEARRGVLHFGGREIPVFRLRFFSEKQGLECRCYLSEAGEPLKIETDLGFEVLSEVLVPLDAWDQGRNRSENHPQES